MTHTATPWHYGATPCANNEEALAIVTEEVSATKTESSGYFYVVYVDDGRRTALVGHGPDGAANAEFITRACNAHDDLVYALREIANMGMDSTDKEIAEEARRIARAALSKATHE